MTVEIERKFVLSKPPEELHGAPSTPIEQGYLAITEDGVEVRIRRIGDRTVLTVKHGQGERRLEEEVEIPESTFETLWPLTEGRRIEKERFLVDREDGLRIEVDVYAGTLRGLVVAEVEFVSDDASAAFDPPGWLEREATDDPRYANQRLALDGIPEIEGEVHDP